MSIPVSSTTIAILRAPELDDGYPDAEPVYTTMASGIRAHFARPRGIELGAAGQRSFVRCRMVCDMCDLLHTDLVQDENTARIWQVDWVEPRPNAGAGTLSHVVAGVHFEDAELEATAI